MKRTDKEIVSAMEYIKSQHNGELPYKFGTFECAKMMAKYLIEQSSITAVVQVCGCIGTRFASETINGLLCNICGNKIEGANGSFKPRNILE